MGAVLLRTLACALFCLAAQAKTPNLVEYLHVFENRRLVHLAPYHATAPSFAAIERAYKNGEFSNYPEFVSYLFSRAPHLKNSFVLLPFSESLQLSSPEHPRVLLFDGQRVYALSEHPEQKKFRLEMLEGNQDTFQISLAEAVFEPTKGVQFEANPKSCAACHGSPAKPLWNPYDFWPHAYGSTVGVIGTQNEQTKYQSLVSNASKSVLLRHMNLPKTLELESEGLTAFTQLIQQLNLGRWIKANLSPAKLDSRSALPLIGSLGLCISKTLFAQEPGDYGVADFRKAFFLDPQTTLNGLTRWGDAVIAGRKQFKTYLDKVERRSFGESPRLFPMDHSRLLVSDVLQTSQLHYILNQLGIDTANLTTSLHGNDFLISSPAHYALDFLTMLYIQRPDLFRGLGVMDTDLSVGRRGFIQVNCRAVHERIANQDFRFNAQNDSSPVFPQGFASQPVIARCSKCHVDGVGRNAMAPVIPFDQPLLLARQLRAPGSNLKNDILARVQSKNRDQMPPNNPLTPSEVQALEAFLNSLAD